MPNFNKSNEGSDVQIFTTTGAGTWTKPSWAKFVKVVCIGAGGGGGGGGSAAAAAIKMGGAGGGGGARSEAIFSASDLGTTEAISVGTGGTAGTGGVIAGGAG